VAHDRTPAEPVEADVAIQFETGCRFAGRRLHQAPLQIAAIETADVLASTAEILNQVSLQVEVESVIAAPEVAILAAVSHYLHPFTPILLRTWPMNQLARPCRHQRSIINERAQT
jgi:hypothetical protein